MHAYIALREHQQAEARQARARTVLDVLTNPNTGEAPLYAEEQYVAATVRWAATKRRYLELVRN